MALIREANVSTNDFGSDAISDWPEKNLWNESLRRKKIIETGGRYLAVIRGNVIFKDSTVLKCNSNHRIPVRLVVHSLHGIEPRIVANRAELGFDWRDCIFTRAGHRCEV